MGRRGKAQKPNVSSESNNSRECVVQENIHTPPTERIGNSGEEGGSQRPKTLKQCVKLNWNFQRGGGGGFHSSVGGDMDIFWNHTISGQGVLPIKP